jgi:hypothetical protein
MSTLTTIFPDDPGDDESCDVGSPDVDWTLFGSVPKLNGRERRSTSRPSDDRRRQPGRSRPQRSAEPEGQLPLFDE